MIRLDDVSLVSEGEYVLDGTSLDVPAGRYALLTEVPGDRTPMTDLLCGIRVPLSGRVLFSERQSWPIGRVGFIRGKLTGSDIIGMVCRMYALRRGKAQDLVGSLLTNPESLDLPTIEWSREMRVEYTYALALLPQFGVYVLEGNLPFSKGRFAALWRSLFLHRIQDRLLIVSTYDARVVGEFCDRAFCVAEGRAFIDERLDSALARYPLREPPAREDSAADEDTSDASDDDLF